MVNPQQGLPYHEWWIEFENSNLDLEDISNSLDSKIQKKNIYYKDLIEGRVLKKLKIVMPQL